MKFARKTSTPEIRTLARLYSIRRTVGKIARDYHPNKTSVQKDRMNALSALQDAADRAAELFRPTVAAKPSKPHLSHDRATPVVPPNPIVQAPLQST